MKKTFVIRKILKFMFFSKSIRTQSSYYSHKQYEEDAIEEISVNEVYKPKVPVPFKVPVCRVISELPTIPESLIYTYKIHKPNKDDTLGITIVGGCESQLGRIYIKKISENGVIGLDDQLKEGDEIMMFNAQSFDGKTHKEAVNCLRNTCNVIDIMVMRMVDKKQTGSSISKYHKSRINYYVYYNDEPDILEEKPIV